MNFIKRNIKRLFRLWYCLSKINWLAFYKNYSRKEGVIIVIPGIVKNYFINSLELDLLNIAVLLKLNQKIKLHINNNFGSYTNRRICYNPSDLFNTSNTLSNAEHLSHLAHEAENKQNKIFLSSYEILFWENKEFMHQKFEELNIRTPRTAIANTTSVNINKNYRFPLLVKELHSHASLGVHKCNSENELNLLISDPLFIKNNDKIIIQELLNIRKDLRVILCGDEILLHYWRINKGTEWKPTSTSHGSDVDFISFPEKWRNYIIENFKKLQITTGAFDVAWENDDLDTEPYFLEVSPSYQPNPSIDLTEKEYSYGQFKKKILFNNSWDKLYIDCVFTIKQKLINSWLSK